MVSMKQHLARRSRSSSSRPDAKASRWISRLVCELNSVWLTKGRETMRTAATAIFVLILSGLGTMAATDAPPPADQARTMSDEIERVNAKENGGNNEDTQYTTQAEADMTELKPDDALGNTPDGI